MFLRIYKNIITYICTVCASVYLVDKWSFTVSPRDSKPTRRKNQSLKHGTIYIIFGYHSARTYATLQSHLYNVIIYFVKHTNYLVTRTRFAHVLPIFYSNLLYKMGNDFSDMMSGTCLSQLLSEYNKNNYMLYNIIICCIYVNHACFRNNFCYFTDQMIS